MRILFLCHSFNSLSQRLFIELTRAGHEVSVEFDIHDAITEEAVALFRPELIVAPFLKRAIPESVWRKHVCLVVHPGIKGDRGPSALDWAILDSQPEWGVTVLQAGAEMDGGDIWASAAFPLRLAKKSSLYRNEVTEAAVTAMLDAVAKFATGGFEPEPLDYSRTDVRGRLRPLLRQHQRSILWTEDSTVTVLRKIHAADGFPGVLDTLHGEALHLFDARSEANLGGRAGDIIARSESAICRATTDGAVWIGHLQRKSAEACNFKLPATRLLAEKLDDVPEIAEPHTDIQYREKNRVGYLSFDFYNGAMASAHCERLLEAYRQACQRDTRVIVLLGGEDFWSNGIHLNLIEAADSPADESWRNINAMNDLTQAILTSDQHLTIAALRGNAGAGGVFLALAADQVLARSGVVLNPHYKAMGNLYGSEYWTYLLPRRVGEVQARRITDSRLPLGAAQAREIGLLDACFGDSQAGFLKEVESRAEALAAAPGYPGQLAAKRAQRLHDEASKPLAIYRSEELERMRLNFYGFDSSYHVARHHFVNKLPQSRTPRHLALHRRPQGR